VRGVPQYLSRIGQTIASQRLRRAPFSNAVSIVRILKIRETCRLGQGVLGSLPTIWVSLGVEPVRRESPGTPVLASNCYKDGMDSWRVPRWGT
jgi:hypothetical protein